jgi:hypothetical protein
MHVALEFDPSPCPGLPAQACAPGWYQGFDRSLQVMLVLPGTRHGLLFREGTHQNGGVYAPLDGVPGRWTPLTRPFTLTVTP